MSESTAEATPPPPSPASSRLPFVARILAGGVVVAIVVGIGLVARELSGDDDLTLPDRVGGRYADDTDEALEAIGEERRAEARATARASAEYNSEQLSDAHDGAEAAARRYGALAGEGASLFVTAVSAESGPPLPVAFDDPEQAGTAAPGRELVEEGDVTCLVSRNAPPQADGDPSEADLAPSAVLCQRTGSDLTVRVFGAFEPDLDDVVDATEEVWDHLR